MSNHKRKRGQNSPNDESVTLPEEILHLILSNLNFKDLVTCCLVCLLFNDLVRESKAIQYISELEIAGLVDGGSASTLSASDRLNELLVVQHNWTYLKFRSTHTVRRPNNSLWELFGGVLAFGRSEWSDGPTTGISFIQLPSQVRGQLEPRRWEHKNLGVNRIRDFGMDPSQDLVVLIIMRTEPESVMSGI
ncbi:hypothetical protein M422DRAFT_276176 [Sphaerobolus stellatus SS14]|uniref:F-box domain-containing protein n=1 Tax=Sphaerobolus stellatus (strain SS14) TaxID=990650 RepID=A0A0C9T349_SPHS4|nr:hypothetical protein M422DRAFT_276176 [Sphaerobolus stellatus SS14]